jgi:hypothetical protein
MDSPLTFLEFKKKAQKTTPRPSVKIEFFMPVIKLLK